MKAEEGEDSVEEGGGHRVLVFAQLKGMLDLVAHDLLSPLGIPFLRLDGRCWRPPPVPPTKKSLLVVWEHTGADVFQVNAIWSNQKKMQI